jgi:hypothetical protein
MTQPLPGYVKVTPTAGSVTAGTAVGFQANFFNLATGLPADPALVDFSFSVAGAAATTYRYGTDPQVTKTSVGVYNVDIPTADMSPAGSNVSLVGQYDGFDNGTGTIAASGSATVLVTAPPIPDPFG